MANYHIQQNSDGTWGVKQEGASRNSANLSNQQEAIDKGRALTESSGGGELRIHRADNNQIHDTRTIAKPDPYPPKDKR